MPRYYITEPHPTIVKNTYTHSGRGGAGNIFKAPATTPASGVSTTPNATTSTPSTRFYSGRGGAGNTHSAAERHVMSFDEEYGSALAHESLPVGHVGRGGAGNVFGGKAKSTKGDAESSRRDSSSTNGSVRSGFWGRLSGSSLGHH